MIMKTQRYLLCLLCALFASMGAAATQTLSIRDQRFSAPLDFTVSLPASYHTSPKKRYALLFDFHYYADSYLTGMHDWLSHNGEWPWPETIIVTPKRGNPVGQLFDSSGETSPLIRFFAEALIPEIDKAYRTNSYRIFSGFRVNGTVVLSAMLRHPTLFDAYFVTSPELKDNYAGILSSLEERGLPAELGGRYLLFSHGNSVKESHQTKDYRQLNQLLREHADTRVLYDYQDLSERAFMSLPLLTLLKGIETLHNHRRFSAQAD